MNTIKVARLRPGAHLPTRKNPTDASMDFYACDDCHIDPHSCEIVGTGVTVEVPEGYMMLLKPKGKNAHLVGSGVVDANYAPGEILVRVFNTRSTRRIIVDGTAVAQGVLIPVITPEIEVVYWETLAAKHGRSGRGGILDGNTTE